MTGLSIVVAQFNPVVGDLAGNCARIFELYEQAASYGAELVVFPEMATTGYPIEDLALSGPFCLEALEHMEILIDKIKASGHETAILFGALITECLYHTNIERNPNAIAMNGAVLFDPLNGSPEYTFKYELPNYGVFDEKRVFHRATFDHLRPLPFRGHRLGVMICEDAWFPAVTKKLVAHGADALISLNGSPFEVEKNVTRMEVIHRRLDENSITLQEGRGILPFLYVNMVGGQDELVFDGGSFLITSEDVETLPVFTEEMRLTYLPIGYRPKPETVKIEPTGVSEIYQACVLGLRDYAHKQKFKSVVLGMSGGVDSGIVGAIAADALGAENVQLVRLPSKYSSQGSLDDAQSAAQRLHAPIRTVPIEGVVNALREAYTGSTGAILTGTADENIQARARGNILMAISNQEGHLLLSTGNKSEVSVGFCTIYGDMAGGFNPIKDCYKTTVWDMCRFRNGLTQNEIHRMGFKGVEGEVVPEEIITKPPSAELRPDQQDSDSLPPYDVLDAILRGLIEWQCSIEELVIDGFDENTVRRIRKLIDGAEYKRRQSAPGIKITSKLHGRERRVPIINHFIER